MTLRILVHAINFSPELVGAGKYTGELAIWLRNRGHHVRVVTAPPYYPDWKVWPGFPAWRHTHDPEIPAPPSDSAIGSLRIIRCPLWVPAKPTGWKRLLHQASFSLSSFPLLLHDAFFWRPNLVVVVTPPLSCMPWALLASRLSGAVAWLHIQDFDVDAAFGLGMLKSDCLRKVLLTCERWLLRRFDKVSTISQRMIELAESKGVDTNRLTLFRNWASISSPADPTTMRATLGIADAALVALYSGSMGNKQGLEILAEVATILRDDRNLVFVFCGKGSGRSELVARCTGLLNVRFLDLQPIASFDMLLSTADIHLLPQRADAADLVMPSKLSGMLASGRPIVATAMDGTELANVVNGRGLVVPPGDARAFADAIARLARNSDLRFCLGAAARQFARDNLNRDAILTHFATEFEAMCKCSH